MKFSPIEDKVLLKPIVKKDLEVTAGGIVKPVTAKSPTIEAEVIAVGEGRHAPETGHFIPTSLKPKDIVLVGTDSGMPITIDGEDYKLLREGDVLLHIGRKQDGENVGS